MGFRWSRIYEHVFLCQLYFLECRDLVIMLNNFTRRETDTDRVQIVEETIKKRHGFSLMPL